MNLTTSLSLVLALILVTAATAKPTPQSLQPTYNNRIILIRHAEKGFTPGLKSNQPSEKSGWPRLPPWGPPGRPGRPGGPGGKFPNGLSDNGRERAQYIRKLFGNESEYDFGKIFAAPRDEAERDTERTYATVAPLAKDLGLKIDINCANSEASCIVDEVSEFVKTSEKDILISWKHRDLNVIATALGAANARRIYPDERNDVIWIMQNGQIVEKRSMHCPGLDDQRVDEGDPDLEVEKSSLSFLAWLISFGGVKDIWRAQRQVVTTSSM